MNDKTLDTVKIFDDAAMKYQEKYMDVSTYKDGLSLFISSLDNKLVHILDVACGPGNVAKYILDLLPEARMTAIDLSEKMLELAQSNIPQAETLCRNAKDIKLLNQKFDGILASFIFPYLSKNEVLVFIKDSYDILNPGGSLYISTMVGKNSDSGYKGPSGGVQMFINYHEQVYLERALEDSGFDIMKTILQSYDYGAGNAGIDIIIIGKKKD